MERLVQTILHDPANGKIGNCWPTCIAMVLEEDPSQIPHFVAEDPNNWWANTVGFLHDRGLTILAMFPCLDTGVWSDYWAPEDGATVLLTGVTDRSPTQDFESPDCLLHTVVGVYNTSIHEFDIFDPHPLGTGLTKTKTIDMLVPWHGRE